MNRATTLQLTMLSFMLLLAGAQDTAATGSPTNQLSNVGEGGAVSSNQSSPSYFPNCAPGDPFPYNTCGVLCWEGCTMQPISEEALAFDAKSWSLDYDGDNDTMIRLTSYRPAFTGALGGPCPINPSGDAVGSGFQRSTAEEDFDPFPPERFFTGAYLNFDVEFGNNNSRIDDVCLGVILGNVPENHGWPIYVESGFSNGSRIQRQIALPTNETTWVVALFIAYDGTEDENPDPVTWFIREWSIDGGVGSAPPPVIDALGFGWLEHAYQLIPAVGAIWAFFCVVYFTTAMFKP